MKRLPARHAPVFRSSRPDAWVSPRQPLDPCRRRMTHGNIDRSA